VTKHIEIWHDEGETLMLRAEGEQGEVGDAVVNMSDFIDSLSSDQLHRVAEYVESGDTITDAIRNVLSDDGAFA
jgi:hypothetical protein